MEMRKRAEQVPDEPVRRSQLVKSSKATPTDPTDNSWQQEAAVFLLRSGFLPGDTPGQVHHFTNPHRAGRTFGSVWNAMRRSVGAAQEEDHPQAPQ
jgi:hypothetical protein